METKQDWRETSRLYWIIRTAQTIDRLVTGAEAHRIEREFFRNDYEDTKHSDVILIEMCRLTIERIEKSHAYPIAA